METQTQSPYVTSPRTPAWGWIVMALGVVAVWVVTAVAGWLVMFGFSSTCNEPPDLHDVRMGQLNLLGLVAFAVAPWVLGWVLGGRRPAFLVCGVAAALPALVFLLNGLRVDAWVGGFCF
jgi:hypothetical protein